MGADKRFLSKAVIGQKRNVRKLVWQINTVYVGKTQKEAVCERGNRQCRWQVLRDWPGVAQRDSRSGQIKKIFEY